MINKTPYSFVPKAWSTLPHFQQMEELEGTYCAIILIV
jgi:hypothetical protein